MTNLWLIPASNPLATTNLALSMENEIDIEIRHALRERGIEQRYAWGAQRGTNDSNLSIYRAMQAGDICLFYTADQREVDEPLKAYRWAARITDLLEDHSVADQVWPPEQPGKSFELMYFLTTPVKIYITTEQLSLLITKHGEKYASPPKGFMKLDQRNLDFVRHKYGSPEAFLTHVLTDHGEEDAPVEDYPDVALASSLSTVAPIFVDDLLSVKTKSKGKSSVVAQRRSKLSKEVGDEAELYILELLREGRVPGVIATQIQHVADQKVGWDIQYYDEHDNLVKVEVKGSTASKFSNFELTINELNCLKEHANLYHFYLVGGCRSTSRRVQIIKDMAKRLADNNAVASPITFRLELLESR
ncbi:DUF3883 domain-containing protein [Pseudomonas sp. WS 5071]|uniref:DUF3883 domain-containing protein n=1 Tax=Pseudomonas sp. WS 5071 TaxID=2717479 RepID=UPI0014759D15|nr:DUF3883 domain-containing protein [Pseudomonas sp. WS 5071]NMY75631.1 DUF3883 domain-containing protein [Pseudomonas sp. WS 5071]